MTAPALGTPASGVLTNTTGYPGDTSLVTTGVLNSGSINTSFGTINNNAAITGTTVTGSTALVGGTVAGTTGTFSGVVDITNTTDASDATGDTGALRTEGGASIAAKLYVGTDLSVGGTANLDDTDIDGTLVVDGSNISLDSTATLNIDNSNTSNGISIGTATASVPIAIGHGTSVTTFGDDVIITGDLTINGTTTTVASSTLTVADPLVKYNQGDVNAARDAGFIVTRGNSSASNTANRGFIWDASEGEFAAVAANTEDGTTSGNVTINDYVDLRVGALVADDGLTGALTGNADTVTTNANLTGDVTSSGSNATAIAAGVIIDNDVNASAAIAYSKLAALASGNILVGNGSNVAVSVNPSGDVDVTNAGVFSIASGSIIDDDVKSDAAIAMSKTALSAGTGLTLSTNSLAVDAAQTQITSVGTIGTGVWQGTPVATAYIADNSITLDKLAGGTDGNIISYDTNGDPVAVATGNDGQVLTSAGANAVPTFEDLPAGSAPSGAQTAITTILNAGAKLGRDSQNLIDFATTDNKIILRVNNVDEVELVENALSPVTSNGVSLGTSSLMWSDAFLATGSVLNFNNGNMTVTHSDTVLTVAGGTLATGEIKVAAQQKIYLDGGSHTYIVEENANQLEIYSGQNTFSQFRMTASALRINTNTNNFDFAVSGATVDNVLFVDASADALFLNGDVTLASHKYLKLAENSSIKFTDQIGVDNGIDNDDGQGIIFTFRAGATVTPFSPVYIDGNNEVQEADADAIATMPCIGVTTNTSDVSADADIEVMMLGLIRHDSFADFGAAGAPVYVSAGASGVLTTTAPSGTDDVVQVVGHAIAEDLIFVQPCLTTIEHA
jgi:hypothetical protein